MVWNPLPFFVFRFIYIWVTIRKYISRSIDWCATGCDRVISCGNSLFRHCVWQEDTIKNSPKACHAFLALTRAVARQPDHYHSQACSCLFMYQVPLLGGAGEGAVLGAFLTGIR